MTLKAIRKSKIVVSNIQIRKILNKLEVNCPNCSKQSVWFIYPTAKEQVIRVCRGCGAVLEITIVEEVKDGK